MIESPARITKSQLSAGKPLYGAVNEAGFALDDKHYAAGTLRYINFAGVPVKGSRPVVFEGVNRFEVVPLTDPPQRSADFRLIPTQSDQPEIEE